MQLSTGPVWTATWTEVGSRMSGRRLATLALLLQALCLLGALEGATSVKIALWKTVPGSDRDAAVEDTPPGEEGDGDELESFDLSDVRPGVETGAQLKDKVRKFLSTDPEQRFDLILPDGRPISDDGLLAEQGVGKSTMLKFVARLPSSAAQTTAPTGSTVSNGATRSRLTKAEIATAMKRLSHDTIVEGSDGRIWTLANTVNRAASQTILSKRRIPSSRVFDALFPLGRWKEIERVNARVLEQLTTGPMRVIDGDMGHPGPTTVLKGPLPVRGDLGLEAGEHPFAFGVVSAVSFWFRPWMEGTNTVNSNNNAQTQSPNHKRPRGHRSLFHTYPMLPGVLAPVLMVGDNHKLFLGYIDSRTGKEVNLKGVMTSVEFTGRIWEHIAVLFDAKASSLQLYHNGQLASTPVRVSPLDSGRFPRIAPLERSLVFGKGKLLHGAQGLVDKVMVHYGSVKAVNEIRNEWMYGSASKRQHTAEQSHRSPNDAVPSWLDNMAWPLASDDLPASPSIPTNAVHGEDENQEDGTLSMFGLGMALLSAPPPPPPPGSELPSSSPSSSNDGPTVSQGRDRHDSDVDEGDMASPDFETSSDWRARTLYALVLQASRRTSRELAWRRKWMDKTLISIVDAAVPRSENGISGSESCLSLNAGWWTYDVCRGNAVIQRHEVQQKKNHPKKSGGDVSTQLKLGTFDPQLTTQRALTNTKAGSEEQLIEVYTEGAHCDEINRPRKTSVVYRCCESEKPRGSRPFVLRVEEPNVCEYRIIVCVNAICLRDGRGMLPSSTENKNEEGKNVVYQSENVLPSVSALASSSWSKLFTPEKAIDRREDTFWKATRSSTDSTPWIMVDMTPEGRCNSGVESIRLTWDLAPEAYSIAFSTGSKKPAANSESIEEDRHFVEAVDVARQAVRQRTDYFDAQIFPDPLGMIPTQLVNVSITSVGPWTAPSLTDFVVKCKPQPKSQQKSPPLPPQEENVDEGSDENVDVLAGPFEPVRGILSQMTSIKLPSSDHLSDGSQQDHAAAMQSFALHILISERDGIGPSVLRKESSSDNALSSGRTYLTNPWSSEDAESGSFLALAAYHDNGGLHPRESLHELLHQIDSAAEHAPGTGFDHSREDPETSASASIESCMSAAALYRHEAYLSVGGALEGSKHPVPIQHLQLSSAKNDEIDRHRDSGGDEGQYQQAQASQGDVNAIKWIASRHYHGLNGFERDLPRAAEYFRQAADAGDAEARYNYAVMRLTGQDGEPANPGLAHTYFEEAAANDFPPALNGLGLRYMGGDYTGHGEPPDYKKAFEYFSRSARKNSADGHYNLAALYKDGQGVEKNIPAAMMHFAVAAALGQHRAQWMLGDALHSRSSFLAKYLAKALYLDREQMPPSSTKPSHFSWSNEHDGINITAKSSLAIGVHVRLSDMQQKSDTTMEFPIDRISCTHAVQFFRPLAETRAAGAAYRMGVKSWIEGDIVEAERLFQASSWMGLAAGTSNAAWLLRQNHPGLPPPPPELLPQSGGSVQGNHDVNCGGHRAANCALCPQGHGRIWCNGECSWDDTKGVCYRISSDVSPAAGPTEDKGFLSKILPDTSAIAVELQTEAARVAAGALQHYTRVGFEDGDTVLADLSEGGVVSRHDHAFAYSVQAALRGDMLERVVVAGAIERQVSSLGGDSATRALAREDAIRAWRGAVDSGSPEASSEFGMMYVIGNPLLGIAQNYTAALEHLGNCGGSDVMHEGIGGKPVPLECVPSQLLMWYVWGRQNTAVDVFFRYVQGVAAVHGVENVATVLLVLVCALLLLVGCFL